MKSLLSTNFRLLQQIPGESFSKICLVSTFSLPTFCWFWGFFCNNSSNHPPPKKKTWIKWAPLDFKGNFLQQSQAMWNCFNLVGSMGSTLCHRAGQRLRKEGSDSDWPITEDISLNNNSNLCLHFPRALNLVTVFISHNKPVSSNHCYCHFKIKQHKLKKRK